MGQSVAPSADLDLEDRVVQVARRPRGRSPSRSGSGWRPRPAGSGGAGGRPTGARVGARQREEVEHAARDAGRDRDDQPVLEQHGVQRRERLLGGPRQRADPAFELAQLRRQAADGVGDAVQRPTGPGGSGRPRRPRARRRAWRAGRSPSSSEVSASSKPASATGAEVGVVPGLDPPRRQAGGAERLRRLARAAPPPRAAGRRAGARAGPRSGARKPSAPVCCIAAVMPPPAPRRSRTPPAPSPAPARRSSRCGRPSAHAPGPARCSRAAAGSG